MGKTGDDPRKVILCVFSCGAALQKSTRSRPEIQGKTIVVILPDGGERYLTSVLFDGYLHWENFD